MSWTAPTIAEFKARFNRDFPYAGTNDQANLDLVLDQDIQNGMNSAALTFNEGIGADAAGLKEMYLLLSAFFMVENLKTSAKGIASQAQFMVTNKSVGSVSLGLQVPEAYTKNPIIAQFTANGYGMQYLNLALPFMVGRVGTSRAGTTAA